MAENEPTTFQWLTGMAQVREDLRHAQDTLNGLARAVSHLLRQNDALSRALTHQGARIMAGITEENDSIQALTDAVTKYTGNVSTWLDALQKAKDAGEDTQPFIDRLNAITKAVTDADGALTANAIVTVAPAPVTPTPAPVTPAPVEVAPAPAGTTGADGTTKILP